RRIDWGLTYYRASVIGNAIQTARGVFPVQILNSIYQGNIAYPLNEVQRIQVTAGIRRDVYIVKSNDQIAGSLAEPNLDENFALGRVEFVHDNTINPVTNIWNGFRAKGWVEMFNRLGGNYSERPGDLTFNFGFDARHYLRIYRNFIWAVRGAADVSWGDNKFIYYLGGTDGWIMLGQNQVVRNGVVKERYFNTANRPAADQSYVYESLAVNLRGFTQNAANGNNALVINSELRLPVFTTFFNKPINNAFLRNFQLVQFIDLGTAWNGRYNKIGRPEVSYTDANDPNSPVTVTIKAPGVGPFLGSYGFGARSTLLGYFLRFDAGWQMNGIFQGKPVMHLSVGLDF
ncbi:MAG: hypothetical protein GXC73_12665, partial [Chitinophagaceae bacterium]|nr:hypothetical protein [Chitinophagaceae bacterium]